MTENYTKKDEVTIEVEKVHSQSETWTLEQLDAELNEIDRQIGILQEKRGRIANIKEEAISLGVKAPEEA